MGRPAPSPLTHSWQWANHCQVLHPSPIPTHHEELLELIGNLSLISPKGLKFLNSPIWLNNTRQNNNLVFIHSNLPGDILLSFVLAFSVIIS